MAAQPALVGNGWLSVPWAAYIGQGAGNDGMDGALGHGSSGNQATFAIQVEYDDLPFAMLELLGYYRFDEQATEKYLKRDIPKQHPYFDWLYASRITSIRPMKFTEKAATPVGNYPRHRYWQIVILFQQPKYTMVSDAVLDKIFPPVNVGGVNSRQEWERWAEWTFQGGVETMSIEAGKMKYSEGTGPPLQPTAGSTLFNSPTPRHLSKGTLTCVWRHVPIYGFMSPTTRRPENMISCLGTVNSAAFRNYPAGTLRFDSFSYTLNEAPYGVDQMLEVPAIGNNGAEKLWPSLTVDVTLNWGFFDPPHGNSASRGHNLVPYFPDTSGSWYKVTADGAAGSSSILPTSDHRLIFRRSA